MDMKATPLALLNNAGLLKTDALLNGAWVAKPVADHGRGARFDVNDPATGHKLADVANLGPALPPNAPHQKFLMCLQTRPQELSIQ